MLESQGLQHVFIMSSAVEKMQHIEQHRTGVHPVHITTQSEELDELKKIEVQRSEKTEETLIREKNQEKKGSRNFNQPESPDSNLNDFEKSESEPRFLEEINSGELIDIVI